MNFPMRAYVFMYLILALIWDGGKLILAFSVDIAMQVCVRGLLVVVYGVYNSSAGLMTSGIRMSEGILLPMGWEVS